MDYLLFFYIWYLYIIIIVLFKKFIFKFKKIKSFLKKQKIFITFILRNDPSYITSQRVITVILFVAFSLLFLYIIK